MHRTTRPVLLVVTVAVLLLGTACTSTVPGVAAPAGLAASSSAAATTSAAASTDPVDWMDNVCGALLLFVDAATDQPEFNQSDPASQVAIISDYLGKTVTSLDAALTELEAAGPSPVEGGDEVVTRLTGALTTFRTTISGAKSKIDAVDTSDPQQLATALPEALAPLTELANFPNPTADLASNPELDRAAAKAPNCKKVSGLGG